LAASPATRRREREDERLGGEPQLHERAPAHGLSEQAQDELPRARVEAHRGGCRQEHEQARPADLPDETLRGRESAARKKWATRKPASASARSRMSQTRLRVRG